MRVVTVGVAVVLLGGCGSKGDAPVAERASFVAAAPAPVARTVSAPPVLPQKLIRTAQLRIETSEVKKATLLADSAAGRHGGYVADTKVSRDLEQNDEAQLVFRVPSEQFTPTLADLRKLGSVLDESDGTQDITKEYTDLETRLAVKEQTVARLRGLLSQSGKVADLLEVERELDRVVTELEQMKGERKFYDSQVSFSTITLRLVSPAATHASQFTKPIRDALHGSVDVLGRSISAAIYLVVLLIPWVAIALVGWLITTWVRAWWHARGMNGN